MKYRITLIFSICLFCVPLFSCKSDAEKMVAHFERGNAYADKKEFKSAIIEYKNAIQIDPKFEQAHVAIADAYMNSADPQGAYKALLAATELNPDNLEAQVKLAGLLFLSKERDLSRERVDVVLKKDPKNKEALFISAGLHERAEDWTMAESLYKTLIDIDPANTAARVAYARMLGRLGRSADQEEVLVEGVAAAPKDPSVYLSLYAHHIIQKQFDKAEKALNDGIAALPDNTDLYATLGHFYVSMRQPEKGEAIFKKTIELAPEKPQPYRVLASFYRQTGRPEQAMALLEKVTGTHPDDMEMRVDLAHVYLSVQQAEKAKSLVAEIEKKRPGYEPVKLVKSEILLGEKDFDGALELLNPLVQSQPNNAQAFFLRALANLGKKEAAPARADAVKAIELNTNHLAARRMLAEMYYREKSFDLAVKEFEQVLQRNPGDRDAAVKYGNTLLATKEVEKAKDVYSKLTERFPTDPEGYFRLGALEMRQGKMDDAEAHLARAQELGPERVDIALERVMLFARTKRLDRAITLADEQAARYGEQKPLAAVMLKAKGDLLATSGDPVKAQEAYEAAIDLNPDFPPAYYALAKLFMDRKETDKAISQYRIVLEKDPGSVPAHMVMGTIHQSQGKVDLAEEHYRSAIQTNAEFVPALNNLAYLLADTDKNLDEALELAKRAKEKAPESPFVMDTLGWAYYKKGFYDFAIAEFTEALEKASDQPMLHFHLAMAHYKKEEKDKARDAFQKALSMDANFEAAQEARRILSKL